MTGCHEFDGTSDSPFCADHGMVCLGYALDCRGNCLDYGDLESDFCRAWRTIRYTMCHIELHSFPGVLRSWLVLPLFPPFFTSFFFASASRVRRLIRMYGDLCVTLRYHISITSSTTNITHHGNLFIGSEEGNCTLTCRNITTVCTMRLAQTS